MRKAIWAGMAGSSAPESGRPNQVARQKRKGIRTKRSVSARMMKVQRLLRGGRLVEDAGELLTLVPFSETHRITEPRHPQAMRNRGALIWPILCNYLPGNRLLLLY